MGTAAILFAAAAVGGAVMAAMRLSGRELPPLALALLHGALAASGLVVLVLTVAGKAVPTLEFAAIAGFVLAAIGGAILLLGFHLRKKALPVPLVLIHGSVAVVSFILLLTAIFSS